MPADPTESAEPLDHPDVARSNPGRTRRGLLAWCAASTGLLLGAGGWRLAGSAAQRPEELSVRSPFPLGDVPRRIDGWVAQGEDAHLDPVTTRIAGATDHISRLYCDEVTGTALSLLILYGPAEPVLPHTPQVCYPASGYRSLTEPVDRTIRINDHLSAVFRAGLFGKAGGRAVVRHEVYHSYRLDGVWSPAVSDRNLPRRRAGLFKVQVWRRVLDGERTDADEPIEAFLPHLIPVIERLIAASGQPVTPAPAAAATSPVAAR